MDIRLGNFEVLFTGTVICILNEPIEFQFPGRYKPLKIIAKFVENKSESKTYAIIEKIGEHTIELEFVNFGRDLGSGNEEVLDLGYFGYRKIYLNYRVYAIQGLSNTLHYTFYSEREGGYDK